MTYSVPIEYLDGVAYLVDRAGRVVCHGKHNWDKFAADNQAPELCQTDNIVGLPLLDIVQGDDVRRVYRELMSELLAGTRGGFAFGFHCDSPEQRRQMRMSLTAVYNGGEVSGILFQSVMLNSTLRPPLNIFRFRELAAMFDGVTDRPIVTICSYCQDVASQVDGGSDRLWISAEEYYQRGGGSEVRISHGVCEDCQSRVFGG